MRVVPDAISPHISQTVDFYDIIDIRLLYGNGETGVVDDIVRYYDHLFGIAGVHYGIAHRAESRFAAASGRVPFFVGG